MIHLAVDWRFDPEYRFGWFVPVMMAFVLAARFRKGRPKLNANRARLSRTEFVAWSGMLVSWPLLRVVGIANPDWHMFSWITVLTAIGMTMLTLHSVGGMRLLRCYGVPFLMVAAVVPWPFVLEQHLINGLKAVNAFVVTEILHLCGTAAVRESGGIIVMPNAILGIEEGCTGIRSLHLCLAVALFWGEWFRLSMKNRAALVGGAFLIAIMVNVVRTLSLAMLGQHYGRDALEQWHDRVGLLAQVVVVTVCWVLTGWLIARSQRWSRGRFRNGERPETNRKHEFSRPVRLRGWVFCAAAIWIVGSEATARLWFERSNFGPANAQLRWNWRMPPAIDGLRREHLPARWITVMAADGGYAGSWLRDTDGRRRYIYGFHWREGRPAAIFATHHRPEDCLPGSGFDLVDGPTRVAFETKGETNLRAQPLPFSFVGRSAAHSLPRHLRRRAIHRK